MSCSSGDNAYNDATIINIRKLAHKERYARKYTAQSFLLLLPLVVPILAILQEWQKRAHQ